MHQKQASMANKTKKPITFILLDGSVVSYGFRVNVDGVDLAQFERNPVMFYLHDDYKLPIGRWVNIRKEEGRILADAEFDYDDPDLEVKRIIGKVERGFIRMASSGLADPVFDNNESLMLPGQTLPTLSSSRMREASIVNIGANHNALRLYDGEGNEIDLTDNIKLSDMIRPKQIHIKMNDELKKLLNLSDSATDTEIAAAVRAILSKNKELTDAMTAIEAKVKSDQKAEAVLLVDAAIKDARIDANGKEAYLKLFDSDFETAKAMLAAIPKRQSVTKAIEENRGASQTELADFAKSDWDTLDKADRLIVLRDKYPELYKEKYKAKFGVELK